MEIERAKAILHKLAGPTIKVNGQWVTTNCPLAGWRHQKGTDSNPSFGLNTGVVPARVHCFSCHFSGTVEDMVTDMHLHKGLPQGLPYSKALALVEEDDVTQLLPELTGEPYKEKDKALVPFDPAWLEKFIPLPQSPDGMGYMFSRGYGTLDYAPHLAKLWWDPKRRRVCFPMWYRDGNLYGMRGRAIDKDIEPRYYDYDCNGVRNPSAILGDDMFDPDKPVVVVEGSMDRLKVLPAYRNVVSVLTSMVSQAQVDRLSESHMALVMGDGDKAGHAMFVRFRSMAPKTMTVTKLPVPDDMDPGGMELKAIKKTIGTVLGLW
jgi:hypothetical protein